MENLAPNIDVNTIIPDDDSGDPKHKKKKAAAPVPAQPGPVTIQGGGLSPDIDTDKIIPQQGPNYVPTKDPNVLLGRNGVMITRAQFDQNQKSNMPFNDFNSYADWVGGWAHPQLPIPQISPYYRTYGGDNIKGQDIMQLYMKNDPTINKILDRNMAKPGDVPQYGADDGDSIRQLIAKNNADNQMLGRQ